MSNPQLKPNDAHAGSLVQKISHLMQNKSDTTDPVQMKCRAIANKTRHLSLFQLGKVYGIESHVLSPAETKDLYPLMNVDDLYGTLYVPKDGTMDPAGTCTTLTRAASARGATVT